MTSPPPSTAMRTWGTVTRAKVRQGPTPRVLDVSSSAGSPVRSIAAQGR